MASAHAVLAALLAASGSSSGTKNNTNPLVSLLPLVLIFGLAYVFFLRPRAQAARRQRETLTEVSPGDEILTGAGIFGKVLDVESDRVTIETAPGTRITVLRSTIARRLTEPPEEESDWHDEGPNDSGWGEEEEESEEEDRLGHEMEHAEEDELGQEHHEGTDTEPGDEGTKGRDGKK
jgi:preprotein translocase subunit YajC